MEVDVHHNPSALGRRARDSSKPVVGVGASAGGLEVLRAIFSELPETITGSIVVVQHMSPTSKSMLTELLTRETKIPVVEATDGLRLQANRIYVTPPNADITIKDHQIQLGRLEGRVGPKPSIDRFLSSLADDCAEDSVACILSGTGSDGAQGCRAVKAAGGVTIVQEPGTAKYDGMPRSAIATGAIDMILAPDAIAREISAAPLSDVHSVDDEDDLSKKVFDLLQKKTNVNFALYKPNTINRRLQRRMNALKCSTLGEYYSYLCDNPEEVDRLYQDVLISVTAFFRDTEQFDAAEDRLKDYISNHRRASSIRIWSAGCATGEEPYSLAIAALEALKALNMSVADMRIQVFATDINEAAMSAARAGVFSATALEGLPEALVSRYFTVSEGGYRISKEVRDMVLFARHDLTAAPPFLKMDLISCRNLFIYFEPSVQDRILRIFHYALNPHGLLFLGKSESLGQDKSFFRVLDSTAKIFERGNRVPDAGMSFGQLKTANHRSPAPAPGTRRSQAEIERGLIREFCPDSVVLADDFRVLAVYGEAARFLCFPDGPLDQRLDVLLRPELKNQLMTLLHRSRRAGRICRSGPILLREGENREYVHAGVYPVHAFGDPRFVMGFHTVEASVPEEKTRPTASSGEIVELERELMATREHLQSVIEEQEASNEELQALNEELQSANEELQSSNEELETSNEELQSANEELTTLNEELNIKTNELAELSAHLNAVQNAIINPVLVVDDNFNLININDKSAQILKIGEESLGRNFRLMNSPFDLDALFKIIEDCLRSGDPKEERFKSRGYDFDAFCLPIVNRTTGTISGAVATLVDNTVIQETLRRADLAKRSMYRLMDGIPAKVSVRDASGVYTYVNPTFCQTVGMSESEILGKTDVELFGASSGKVRRQRDLDALKGENVSYGDEVHPVDGSSRVFHTARVPLWDDNGHITSVCSVGVDVSDRVLTETRLRELQSAISRAEDGFAVLKRRNERYYVSFASQKLCSLCNLSDDALATTTLEDILFCLDSSLAGKRVNELVRRIGETTKCNFQLSGAVGGTTQHFDLKSFRVDEHQIFLNIFDITESRTRELQLRKQEEEIERSGRLAALGQMAAGIAHELKTPLSTIQSYVDLIRELQAQMNTPSAPPIADAMDKIEATTTKMSDIIVGLKSIARSDHHESFAPCDLNVLIEDTLKICMFRLRNKGIELRVDSPNAPIMVHAQPTQLSQVLINLINNSVDAIRERSEKWIRLELEDRRNEVVVRVVDSGEGIAGQLASQVMTPFFTTKHDGTGLGLSLSQSIVKAHGGRLEVDASCPNTCFQVTIPRSSEGLTKDTMSVRLDEIS
ncbi:CheR family methyltransferase [Gilvimarinus sp. F26214L]|uniref:CheR family methyltransferase n=1 Tax=Gilvimarinus sp. DZF01 TaxID=3461371 RepID=UPI0040460401